MQAPAVLSKPDAATLMTQIRAWSRELGFQRIGVAGVELDEDAAHLRDWLGKGLHGDMQWMANHGEMRQKPDALRPGTLRVLSVRMDYATSTDADDWNAIADGERAYVARYARGRDYHKLMRGRLQQLSDRIESAVGPFGHRVFVDSAPVMERALARNAGLGWIGKHTCLLDRDAGSWFFLGEIYTDLPLPLDVPATAHCGTCTRCIEICPTQAITAPNRLDARRCIAYLTIEHEGAIPEELRAPIGNRVFGCDDCQLVCPWNKFAQRSALPDFDERQGLSGSQLVHLFGWSEEQFLRFTQGSPIRRIGHERWLRNIAVAIGNALVLAEGDDLRRALLARADHRSPLVREHVEWALSMTR